MLLFITARRCVNRGCKMGKYSVYHNVVTVQEKIVFLNLVESTRLRGRTTEHLLELLI